MSLPNNDNPPPLASGQAFRVAPGQSGEPVASFWKFWVEGTELHAMNRDLSTMKFSVHASGQTHLRLEKRDLQLLAPPLRLACSTWRHALEIRYLVTPDRFRSEETQEEGEGIHCRSR